MTKEMRRQIKNHFPVGFVPFGGNFKDFIKPFVEELDLLQKEMWMKCAEGNIYAGVKNHNANFGCCMCKAPRGDSTNPAFDVLANGWYHHQTDLEIAEINSLQGTARIQMSK
ncbi:4037_t:CDS:2, partial [Paraglomus brasilianum]